MPSVLTYFVPHTSYLLWVRLWWWHKCLEKIKDKDKKLLLQFRSKNLFNHLRHHHTNSRQSTSAQPTLIVYRDTLLQETTEVRTSSSYFLHDPKALLQALNWVFIAAASPFRYGWLKNDLLREGLKKVRNSEIQMAASSARSWNFLKYFGLFQWKKIIFCQNAYFCLKMIFRPCYFYFFPY